MLKVIIFEVKMFLYMLRVLYRNINKCLLFGIKSRNFFRNILWRNYGSVYLLWEKEIKVVIDLFIVKEIIDFYDMYLLDMDGIFWGIDYYSFILGILKVIEFLRK